MSRAGRAYLLCERPSDTRDPELMGSNETRFVELYRNHYKDVYAYCRRRSNVEEAEIASAEVFAIAWEKIDQVPVGDKAVAWMYGVAYKVLGHRWRGLRRRRRLNQKLSSLGVEAALAPEIHVLSRQEESQVMRAAERLKPTELEILRLAVWEELPASHISVMLDLSIDAVRQRLSRAKKRLTHHYNALEDDFSKPTAAQKGGGM